MTSQVTLALREEAQKREEGVSREAKLRQEGLERAAESFHAALREERRQREKEDLRIEGASLNTMLVEQRTLRDTVTDLSDRLTPQKLGLGTSLRRSASSDQRLGQ